LYTGETCGHRPPSSAMIGRPSVWSTHTAYSEARTLHQALERTQYEARARPGATAPASARATHPASSPTGWVTSESWRQGSDDGREEGEPGGAAAQLSHAGERSGDLRIVGALCHVQVRRAAGSTGRCPTPNWTHFVPRLARRIASFPVDGVRAAKQVINGLTLAGAEEIRADAQNQPQGGRTDQGRQNRLGTVTQLRRRMRDSSPLTHLRHMGRRVRSARARSPWLSPPTSPVARGPFIRSERG